MSRRSELLPARPSGGGSYLVRQPIFDSQRVVYGYELLFRAPAGSMSQPPPGRGAPAALADAVLAIGLDTLTHGRRAFVSIAGDALLEGVPTLLPPERVVVALGDDTAVDRDTVQACAALKKAGYRIALQDFPLSDLPPDLMPLADYIRVAYQTLGTRPLRAADIQRLGRTKAQLVVGGLATAEQFERVVRDGFSYFQGSFFGQAVIRQTREIPAKQMACLQLLHALNRPNLSMADLEDIIKHDAMLTYRLLRAVSSAATALPHSAPAVRSVQLALTLLGIETVRRWASIWMLAALAEQGRGAQAELVTMAVIRARCCELLDAPTHEDGFLLGMCSLLDAILGQPPDIVLGLLPLADDVRHALCGGQNPRRVLLDCVIAYERGDWDTCEQLAARAGLDAANLPSAYREALAWTRGLQGTAA
ncbi:MAG: HDOD domain-containing protein [Acidobacteria bacterium]|nr:HDOD domain-containing protein [Acidobacteriota bacterium]